MVMNAKEVTEKIVDNLRYRLQAMQLIEDDGPLGPVFTTLIEEIVKGILDATDQEDIRP